MQFKQINCFLKGAALFLLTLLPTAHLQAAEDGTAYAILAFSENAPRQLNHIVSFSYVGEEAATYTTVVPYTTTSTAGAYGLDAYYLASSRMDGTTEVPDKLVKVDLEKGTTTTIGALQGFSALIADMTFDHATATMYGISKVNDNQSILFTVDLTTAATKTVATLDRRFYTLAASMDGQLYGIDASGDFCLINKTNGQVTFHSNVGYQPVNFQTMEFNHLTGKIMWAANIRLTSGQMYMDYATLCELDPVTGILTQLKSLDEAQLAGLYIPGAASSAGAPAAVTGLTITPATGGADSATLTWTNPSKTFSGEPLKAITAVKIFRDDEEIASPAGQPGAVQSYTDNIDQTSGAYHTYKVYAVNAQGESAPAAITGFVGKDTPAAVTGITVTRLTPASARITWEPVTTGAHGGWTDPAVTYTVVRNPGAVEVATGLTETEYEQEPIDVSAAYSYTITAVNNCGSSEPAESEAITLGPKWGFPFSNDFSEEELAQWTVVDANADGNSWTYFNLSWAKSAGAYLNTAGFEGDDWLISREMEFDSNATYKFKMRYYASPAHTVELVVLKDADITAEVVTSTTVEFPAGWDMANVEGIFTVEEGGDYYLAIHEITGKDKSYLLIDKLEIEKLVDNNLQAALLSGSAAPIVGNTYNYTVTVKNRGSKPASNFTVKISDNLGNVLGSAVYTDALEAEQTAEIPVTIEFTADMADLTALSAVVEWAADEIASDNTTDVFPITVMPVGTPEALYIGTQAGTSNYQPFNLYSDKYGATLDIYGASEIGIKAGRITGLRYTYNSSYSSPKNVGVKIYLANTDRTKGGDGWIPEDEMTLVYDGLIDMPSGTGMELAFDFDKSFDYDGRNLAVLVATSLANAGASYYSGVYFPYYNSPLEGNKAYCYPKGYSAPTPFDFTQEGTTRYSSVVTLMVQSGGSAITGVVTDSEGAPAADAKVTVEEVHATATADENGLFKFDFIPNGVYTVSVEKFGYEPERQENVEIADEDVALTFAITKIPVYNISGKVVDPVGSPISGAAVALEGYESRATVSAEDGSFSFADVVSKPVTLSVAAPWYTAATASSDLQADWAAGNIELGYAHYTPGTPAVAEAEGGMALSWAGPDKTATLRYDNGEVFGQFGFDSSVGTIVAGNVFRTPIELTSVSWMTMVSGLPHDKMHLYIYDLDEEGNPTSTLLYSERNIENIDEEWTEHALTEPVSAPRGCLVALNYPGFHGIAIDSSSRSYPVQEQTVAYSIDYNGGEFSYVDAATVGGNLLIRAEGYLYPAENEPVATVGEARGDIPAFQAYKVMRSAGDDNWTELQESTPDTDFVDSEWATLPVGSYRYAVASVYPDGSVSEPAYSCFLFKNMEATVKLAISTNAHSASAEGATVVLSGNNGDSYNATIGAEGIAVFEDLFRQNYDLTVSLPGYATIAQTLNLGGEAVDFSYTIVLEEIIATPVNIEFGGDEQTGYLLTWNESGEIEDSFEDHEPFTIASPGEIGWQYIDGDGARTFAEADFRFPGITQPMSMMAFFPKLTEPSIYDERTASRPHSGDAELACFAGFTGSDDWFISPRLNYHCDFEFTFWARGYSQTYGEEFHVGYSTTDADKKSFTWITPVIDVPKQVWTEYSYTIPAEAKYVAINVVSSDGFILFIDDVTISSGKGFELNTAVTGPEVEYEVLLDGEVVATTDATELHLDPVGDGIHTLGIRAVYASGTSDTAELTFGDAGIGSIDATDAVSVSPNPATDYTIVNTVFEQAALYTLSGRLVASYDGTNGDRVIRLDNVGAGFYLLTVKTADGRTATVKLTVK
ncbi:MAG: carboxypeptidase regulatory-like domain-containing protein [Muribaculaceae bacterium]|nr:carboxypeptidase regulatory-like domain-containing protein [Muribaculaceae bacterium]